MAGLDFAIRQLDKQKRDLESRSSSTSGVRSPSSFKPLSLSPGEYIQDVSVCYSCC